MRLEHAGEGEEGSSVGGRVEEEKGILDFVGRSFVFGRGVSVTRGWRWRIDEWVVRSRGRRVGVTRSRSRRDFGSGCQSGTI